MTKTDKMELDTGFSGFKFVILPSGNFKQLWEIMEKGKLTISMAIFKSYVKLPEGNIGLFETNPSEKNRASQNESMDSGRL